MIVLSPFKLLPLAPSLGCLWISLVLVVEFTRVFFVSCSLLQHAAIIWGLRRFFWSGPVYVKSLWIFINVRRHCNLTKSRTITFRWLLIKYYPAYTLLRLRGFWCTGNYPTVRCLATGLNSSITVWFSHWVTGSYPFPKFVCLLIASLHYL